MPDSNIIPMHRGTYKPPFPRYVRPIDHAEKARALGDPDAVFVRGERRDVSEFDARFVRPAPTELRKDVADLDAWLNRPRRRTNWSAVLGGFAVALAVGVIVYFAAQLLRAVL